MGLMWHRKPETRNQQWQLSGWLLEAFPIFHSAKELIKAQSQTVALMIR